MKKLTLIIASFLGLALAVVATILIRTTLLTDVNDSLVLLLNVVAAGIAGRVTLGRRRPYRFFTLGIVVFAAVAGGLLSSAVTSYLLSNAVSIGKASWQISGNSLASAIAGGILYLAAATVYGFAGTRLGVPVRVRIGLLLLLLLAVFPGLNVVGMLGFAILSFTRRPKVTPARPAASG
jgi:ABC-type glycerol-3-phosphate transport system permease component